MAHSTSTSTHPISPQADLAARRVPLYVRIHAHIPVVVLELTHGQPVTGHVDNLGIGGMHVRATHPVPVGTPVFCCLIDSSEGPPQERYAGGTVVHTDADGMGIAFDKLAPDTFQAICRMIAHSGCYLLRSQRVHAHQMEHQLTTAA